MVARDLLEDVNTILAQVFSDGLDRFDLNFSVIIRPRDPGQHLEGRRMIHSLTDGLDSFPANFSGAPPFGDFHDNLNGLGTIDFAQRFERLDPHFLNRVVHGEVAQNRNRQGGG